MPEIIAVRRNLSPGAVFYMQMGANVYYSLDRVNWSLAWTFPDFPAPSSSVTDNSTVTNVMQMEINSYVANYPAAVLSGAFPAGTPQLMRNLCQASLAAAVIFLTWLDAVNEDRYDENLGALANFQSIIAGAAGVIALLAAPFTGGGSLALYAGIMGAGFAMGSSVSTAVSDLDNVTDQLTEENLEHIACAIRDSMQVTGAGRTAFKNALFGHSVISEQAATAFSSLADALPQMYSTFLTMVTEVPSDACVCDGCYRLLPSESAFTNGNLQHGERIVTRTHRTSYLPSNYKYLKVDWTVPLCQVDSVELEFQSSGHATQSGLTWSEWFFACAVSGPFSQSYTFTLPVSSMIYNAHHTRTFDFSGVTLAHGVDTISFTYRTCYASTGSGQQSLDPLCEAVLTRAQYCERGA